MDEARRLLLEELGLCPEDLDEALQIYIVSAMADEDLDDHATQGLIEAYLPTAAEQSNKAFNLAAVRLKLRQIMSRAQETPPGKYDGEASAESPAAEASIENAEHADAFLYNLPEPLEDSIRFLKNLLPGEFPEDIIRYVFVVVCNCLDRTQAAEILVEQSSKDGVAELREQKVAYADTRSDRERALRKEQEASKRRICNRFSDVEIRDHGDSSSTQRKPVLLSNEVPVDKTRYRDGQIVSTKGEKYLLETSKPEWDGGSRGRIKTKGKRGPGFK